MENGNGGGASSKGVLVPVSENSDVFLNKILAPLKSAYLYEESAQSFTYTSAVLINNASVEEKYNAFRANRREAGYSEEDLKESYGFLLFEDVNKANALGETGVLTGNSACTTLGDPSNGVYISMYSDCLDLNRWYHGKSGYIAIIRLTKGKVKKVLENYTQNFTAPTAGFDCHVSDQLPSVSAKTSSFLAFERTQYYVYELLDDGSNETVQCPSAACPLAIVSFSYTDTKATLTAPQEKSEQEKMVCQYFPWRGQLQIDNQFYNVGLRSTARALIPIELPPLVKVNQAISMLDLRSLLPKAVFETCFSGEVFLDSLYCSLWEMVSTEAAETRSLSTLLCEIKEKDVALTIQLNDGGFLILLHSSHFLSYDDSWSSATEVLQGVFVFPNSRVIRRGTKFGHRKSAMSSEILRLLPVLSYAECEVEKELIEPTEELHEVFVQHMQSYAALINPGLASSPSREVTIFPDQYDVPDVHKHLYSSPEWTERGWHGLMSYLSKPLSFQLPVSKASEILAAGQEEQMEDLDDDVYICLSSPEETQANHVGMESEEELTWEKSPINVESAVDVLRPCATGHEDLTPVSQDVDQNDLQAGHCNKDAGKSNQHVPSSVDDIEAKLPQTPISDHLPAELIVSFTSEERTINNESLGVISNESATRHSEFQVSEFSEAKLLAGVNSLNAETITTKKVMDCSEATKPRKGRKLRKGYSRGWKKVSKPCNESSSLETVKMPMADVKSQKEDQPKESSNHPPLSNSSDNDWRKMRGRGYKLRKLSSKNYKERSATVGPVELDENKPDSAQQSLESTILMELEAFPLRKKTERWDLKPVISECGRILVPHGSVDIAEQIKSLKVIKQKQLHEKILVDGSVNAPDKGEMEQELRTDPETAVEETGATLSKDGGNHPPNTLVSHPHPQNSILRQLYDSNESLTLIPENSECLSKNDLSDSPTSEPSQEKHNDTLNPGKFSTEIHPLLHKLKSVLLRGKRKRYILPSEETTTDTGHDIEPCLKMNKVDSDIAMMTNSVAITSVQDTSIVAKEVSKMLSVDPLFAYALGLTPKETPEQVQRTKDQDSQDREDLLDTKEQTISDKQPRIIQRPLSIFPKRGRIKTLKKHQGISTENVKKKWWLHFQTPACFASEKLKFKEYTRDNSVRKTVKEKLNSACSPTDALNLLADLALGASNDQFPQPPDPTLEGEPDTSVKKCDLTKDVTNAEQESVLHSLLRQPAARPVPPLESPAPTHLMGGSELVGLVSKEHAYSLPPSSSLLLGLSGTPFEISPINGSTRLLHHHLPMYGNGIKILPPTTHRDRSEHNHRTPEYLKKHRALRRKFGHSRTIVNKDRSIEVTKQWQEQYDFNLDSKFTTDSKDRAINRALHGPWDFSIKDTNEEVRLIVHMWIGLFYSRSTARFFHDDLNLTHSCSGKGDPVELSSGSVSALDQPEPMASSVASKPMETDASDPLIPEALDLSKRNDSVFDQAPEILDLSQRNCNAETITTDLRVPRKDVSVFEEGKEAEKPTVNTCKASVEPQEASASQHGSKCVNSEMINDVNDVRNNYASKRTLQKPGELEHIDLPSFNVDGTIIPEKEGISSLPENKQTVTEIDNVLDECNIHRQEGTEHLNFSEMTLVQKHEKDSSESMKDEGIGSSKKTEAVTHTDKHHVIESKDRKNLDLEEKPNQTNDIELAPTLTQTVDELANEKSNTVVKENLLENGKQWKSTLEAHINLSNKPLPIKCDGLGSVKDCIAECNRQGTLDEKSGRAHNEDDTCHDMPFQKLCAYVNAMTDDQADSEKAPHTPLEMEPVANEAQLKENSENGICLAEKAHHQEAALTIVDEINSSVDGSIAVGFTLQSNSNVDTGNQNHLVENVNLNSDDKPLDRKSTKEKQEVDHTTLTEMFQESPLSQCQTIKNYEAEDPLTKEIDLVSGQTTEDLLKPNRVEIPFIGMDCSEEDSVQPCDKPSQSKIAKIPFINDTNYPESIEVCQKSQINKKAQLSDDKLSLSLPDISETKQPEVFGSESDDRCPTPTMDEKPYCSLGFSGPTASSTLADGSRGTCKDRTLKCLSKSPTSIKDEIPLEQKPCLIKPTFNNDINSHQDLHPDLELRTLRVLQSIDNFLSKSIQADKSLLSPNDTSAHLKDKKINSSNPPSASASTSQESNTQSSGHFLISPFKQKLEEVLGVRLQLKKTDSPVHLQSDARTDQLQETFIGHGCPLQGLCASNEPLQAIKQHQDGLKTTSQTNVTHEPRLHNQRPVMAVKPSKSDENQADCISNHEHTEHSFRSTKTSEMACTTPTSMLMETENFMGNSENVFDKQEANELSSKCSLLSSVGPSKFKSGKATHAIQDPLYQNSGSHTSNILKTSPSSLQTQSFGSAKVSSELDVNQGFKAESLIGKVGHATTQGIEIKDYSDASTSFGHYKTESIIDESDLLEPHRSLTCTVSNTEGMIACSFLEQLSKRCLHDSLTQASMEQECLIFSEKMKHLLKRINGSSIRQSDAHDELKLSCTSPVTVHFSSLVEQEDSLNYLDTPSLAGQKIKVEMSDMDDLEDIKEEEKTLHPQKSSPGTSNPLEHVGVSSVTAECARLYESIMNDICAFKRDTSKHSRKGGSPKSKPSQHFDFCDQMKREMDESFRNNLNSVVKKSSKTKYRFFILVTSDDAFFDETKAHLEAEGHTVVQPSEFFLGENSSSLLIILRNEDIAEHICEVPHLLQLKKSPGVQFAGIDEPDDVVNLTHQELFTRGGFLMFDRAALEPLSLCDMKKMSETLQELNRRGKWKWMLHYRDSRRLKENARLSAEAKEKKQFLNGCQESGILETLPYHECDHMSRDQPDYLTCLVRLQVQNISARYPVLVTDATTESTFENNGILTVDFNSFLTLSSSALFPG